LPLLVVQLSGYGMPPTAPAESGWASLREAQRRFAEEDPHTALAISLDIGDRFDIHPPNKQELGRRLARAARQQVYGGKAVSSGPVPLSARREGQSVIVQFGDVADALVAYGADGPIGFELCGTTQSSCRYARAEIRGKDEVVLRATLDAPATRVRYGWADSPVVTLFDRARLPAGPFEIELSAVSRQPVLFDWFGYSGNDAVFSAPLPAGHYRNPVLAGFHSDPVSPGLAIDSIWWPRPSRSFPASPFSRVPTSCTGVRSETSSIGLRSWTLMDWAFRAVCLRRPSTITRARST
jgi:hypothetical protein